jgi:hypothetical protein
MKALMKRFVALIPLLAICGVHAGQPLHAVLKLRTIEVLRCEAVAPSNVAEVSSFVRAPPRSSSGVRTDPSQVADSVPGLLIEGVVRQQRDVTFPRLGRGDPLSDTRWADVGPAAPLKFFAPGSGPGGCEMFVPGGRVNVVLSQKAECDTYPPAGVCAFDHPVRLVDPETWARYGQ